MIYIHSVRPNILLRLKNLTKIKIIVQMFIADSIVVWRCYVVWGRNKYVIAIPVLLLLGTIGKFPFLSTYTFTT